MNTYRFAVYTGPTQVEVLADRFRAAGVPVVSEGTERVFVLASGSNPFEANTNFLTSLHSFYGTAFCLTYRDVQLVCRVEVD